MLCCLHKVLNGRQQDQFVAEAKLRKQSVDDADLNAGSAPGVSDSCGANAVVSVRL